MCFVECYFYIKVSFPSLKSGGSQSDGPMDGRTGGQTKGAIYMWTTVKCRFLPLPSLPGLILMMWRLGVYMMPLGVPHLLVLEIVGMNEGSWFA